MALSFAACQSNFTFDIDPDFVFDSEIDSNDYIAEECEKITLRLTDNFIEFHGGWVYMTEKSQTDDTPVFYRMRPDGSEKQEMPYNDTFLQRYSQGVYYDDWIYYIGNPSREYDNSNTAVPIANTAVPVATGVGCALYRMRFDGSENVKLVGFYTSGMPSDDDFAVSGEWLYYMNGSSLNRIKLDGSGPQLIATGCYSFIVDSDYVFIRQRRNKSRLFPKLEINRYNLDGAYEKTLLKERFLGPGFSPKFTDNGFLYYSSNGEQLRRIKVDGKDKQTIIQYEKDRVTLSNFIIKNNFIYYICSYPNKGAYPHPKELHVTNIDRKGFYAKFDMGRVYELELKLIGDSIFCSYRDGRYRITLSGKQYEIYENTDTESYRGYFVYDHKIYVVVFPKEAQGGGDSVL